MIPLLTLFGEDWSVTSMGRERNADRARFCQACGRPLPAPTRIPEVGLYRSEEQWPERPPWEGELRRGSEGPRVAEWQRDLNLVREDQVVVDGRFGLATHEATLALQRAQGLEPDGIVDGKIRRKMDELLPEFVAPTW